MSDMESRKQRAVNKKDRVPFGGLQTKLQMSEADMQGFKERGTVPRWINDKDGRLERALNAGYTFVDPESVPSLGTKKLHQENTDLNDKVSKVVTRSGEPFRAYLMEINKEWYEEDQAKKEEVNSRVDRSLRPVNQGGQSIESGYTP